MDLFAPPAVDVRRAEAKYILPLTASVGPRFTNRGLIGAARWSGACNPIFGHRSDLLPFKFQIKSRFRSRLMICGLFDAATGRVCEPMLAVGSASRLGAYD